MLLALLCICCTAKLIKFKWRPTTEHFERTSSKTIEKRTQKERSKISKSCTSTCANISSKNHSPPPLLNFQQTFARLLCHRRRKRSRPSKRPKIFNSPSSQTTSGARKARIRTREKAESGARRAPKNPRSEKRPNARCNSTDALAHGRFE